MVFSVSMAIVDYIPVLFFAFFSTILLRDLYNKMSKGAFALLSCGNIMVFFAGLFKATWKLLYALGVCDFVKLNECFFPMQSLGFALSGLAMVSLLLVPQGSQTALAVAPVIFSGTMLFVAVMALGMTGLCLGLMVIALKMKDRKAALLFIAAWVLQLGMGYLSSKDFSSAAMDWAAQGVNILGQGAQLLGVMSLHKAGLEKPDSFPVK